MNKEHYKQVLDKITACPEQWEQISWHCETTHCFAGWAQILSGKQPISGTARRDARMYLNIDKEQADY